MYVLTRRKLDFHVFLGVILSTMATCTANRITKANNQFGTDLFKRVAKDDGNMLISPLSAHVVLSMAYQGADGETAANMAKVFHLPGQKDAAEEYHRIIEQLNKVQSVVLNVANKIYVMRKFILDPTFKSVIQNKFLSEADEIDFAKNTEAASTINQWVENKTKNKIKELIKPDMLDSMTRLVLVNAVYFKGSWAKKFDPALTSKKPFYLLNGEEISVDMMHINSKFKYGEDDTLNCKIIELPYEGNEMSMVVFLPNERNGITQLQEKIGEVDLTEVMKQLSQFTVNLELPKFKIESTIPLKETLEQMGAGHMFTNSANFSRMCKEPLKVSDVIQKTFIEVNEEGAEAAAATDCKMSYPYSDDSTDSDSGIRFKTTTTRLPSSHEKKPEYRRNRRSRSRSKSRDRSRTRDYRRMRRRSRTPDKYRKSNKTNPEKYKKSQQIEGLSNPEKSQHINHRYDISSNPEKYKKNQQGENLSSSPEKYKKLEQTENLDVRLDYGPKLPPKPPKEKACTSTQDDFMGPALPPLKNQEKSKKQDDDDVYGPTLPSLIVKKNPNSPQLRQKVIGPTLPPNLTSSQLQEQVSSNLNPDLVSSSDSDSEILGPLPFGHSSSNPVFMQLEERALEFKLNGLTKAEDDRKREEWMLELPAVHTANLGLGPRQFRAKGAPDMSNRSSWTETPQSKSRKQKDKPEVDIKKEAELEHLKKRDLEQATIVEKHKKKKKRDKSLLDLHQEKVDKKKKEDTDKTRRPFSRDIDLKANRFDEAQKKSILKKAQLLDTRFSSGESKFL